jgi:hypothetical protein
MEQYKEFINELNNSIKIKTAKTEVAGVPGVSISIIGPTSETEVLITRAEAGVLEEQLRKILK